MDIITPTMALATGMRKPDEPLISTGPNNRRFKRGSRRPNPVMRTAARKTSTRSAEERACVIYASKSREPSFLKGKGL